MTKRALLFSAHSATKFTGGRYHSWFISEALAAQNIEMQVVTNEDPIVRREFKSYVNSSTIDLRISSSFNFEVDFDPHFIVLIPDLLHHGKAYLAAFKAARCFGVPLLIFEFESPNWITSVAAPRRSALGNFWLRSSRAFVDVVVSMTNVGRSYAREFFPAHLQFHVCHCCINSPLLPHLGVSKEQKEFVVVTRADGGSSHKGFEKLRSVIEAMPLFGILNLIGSIDKESLDMINEMARDRSVTINVHRGVSDADKFNIIARSAGMIFLSKFEGFGLPPVEAVCCGTRVLAFDLPVLRETVQCYGVRFIDYCEGDHLTSAIKAFVQECAGDELDQGLIIEAREYYSFESLVQRVGSVVDFIPEECDDIRSRRRCNTLFYFMLCIASKILSIAGALRKSANGRFR